MTFVLTNTDSRIPTSNRAPNGGAWPVVVSATSNRGSAQRNVVMNLVPTHAAVRAVKAPVIDGVLREGEYPGAPIPVETIWDGSPMGGTHPSISGQAHLTFDDDNLYVFVHVEDDIRGTILPAADNKRQRRTDSVEIYVDPRGDAPNTAGTLIAGIMPSMDSMTGQPGVGRDRDNWQGEAVVTAPGMQVAVVMADTLDAYKGYDVEVKIPFDVLPDNIDPHRMGFNVVINDSDTQDKAAQRRVGWSTFPGMRADPWRWGVVTLDGLRDRGSSPRQPRLPDTAASSLESPQSILQSATDGVPLGGFSRARGDLVVVSATRRARHVNVVMRSPERGLLRLYVWDGTAVVGTVTTAIPRGRSVVKVALPTKQAGELTVAASIETPTGVEAASRPVRSIP